MTKTKKASSVMKSIVKTTRTIAKSAAKLDQEISMFEEMYSSDRREAGVRRPVKQTAKRTRSYPTKQTGRIPGSSLPTDDYLLSVVREAVPLIHGSGRFGDRKVFLSALWKGTKGKTEMTLDQFKQWMVAQHMKRNVVLARADLVAAMDPELVKASEVVHPLGGATYHFVVDQTVR